MPFEFALNAFITLFVILEPIALAPIFLGVTQGFSGDQRKAVAWRACFIAFFILMLCAFFGQTLLKALGISMPAFRISGGVLLFWISWQMIFGNRADDERKEATDAVTQDHIENVAAFPLAIPLLAGPGAITAMMLLGAQTQGNVVQQAQLLGVLGFVLLLCYLAMLVATPTVKMLGTMGNIVIARLLGVILAALSIQFVIDGLRVSMRGVLD